MRLPVIKHLVEENFDEDHFEETLMVLETLIEARGIKDDELDVIGELISNIEGAKARNKQSNPNPNKEINKTGLLPYLSLKLPIKGAKRNCMLAYKKVIQPPYKAALLKSWVCNKPSIN